MNYKAKILISDDDETLCYLLKEELVNENFDVDIVYDGKYAIEKLNEKNYDLLLLDLEMQKISGEQVLKFVSENRPRLQVIVLTAQSDMRTAIECIKLGAYDFLNKPYDFQHLLVTIERALKHKKVLDQNNILNKKVESYKSHNIIGESKKIRDVINLARRVATSNSNILLEGETGTGKELFAEFIHKNSLRKDKPLVAINCASLPDQLMESELFGYEKGAFTDAKSSKQGLVEIADGGTLFLDEIGEMSLTLQPKLLRFLENGEFRRIGGVKNLSSDIRVIAATNRNLMEFAEQKKFRKDLLFRLNIITLNIPPLAERENDISLLANFFLEKKCSVNEVKKLSVDAKNRLLAYDFPGNVRELEHIIERAIIFSNGDLIEPQDLNLPNHNKTFSYEEFNDAGENILKLDDIEKLHIRKTLNILDWNREETARALGISQKTLYTKIKKYSLK
ncbi:MAG: sigma-54-dependent Fis family transcriptional regulator [Ignavibacteriae bacterium]|nr:MAG: sigma-54-dependent Fis family transcriptional regulator [Ignavibacteriota bacterium]